MHVNIAVVSCQGLLPMFYGQRVHKSRGLKQLNDGFCMDLRSLDWWISAGCWNFCQWTSQSTTSWHGKLHKGGTWPKLAVGRFLDARPLAFLGRRLFALAVVPEIVKQEMIFRYIYIICVCVCSFLWKECIFAPGAAMGPSIRRTPFRWCRAWRCGRVKKQWALTEQWRKYHESLPWRFTTSGCRKIWKQQNDMRWTFGCASCSDMNVSGFEHVANYSMFAFRRLKLDWKQRAAVF